MADSHIDPDSHARGRAVAVALTLSFALFVMLGLPEGVLGTAWPQMRVTFDRPVSSLAWLASFYALGYMGSSLASGHVQERMGLVATILVGASATSIGLGLYAGSWSWWVLLLAALALGSGAGIVDAALNSYLTLAHRPREMHLLHGFFGVGATLGPIITTQALGVDLSWRWIYGLFIAIELALAALVVVWRRGFAVEVVVHHDEPESGPMDRRVLAAMLAFFFLYVGVESAYGQWSFSFLTDERSVGDTLAAWTVAGYWGGLTAGRIGLGLLGDRAEPTRLLRTSTLAIAVLSVVFWLVSSDFGLVALPLLGLAHAGVFPALVLLTPRWLGRENTSRAVGYQLAASSVGAITMSVLLGGLVRWIDLGVVAPTLAAAAVAMAAVNMVALRLSNFGGPADPEH